MNQRETQNITKKWRIDEMTYSLFPFGGAICAAAPHDGPATPVAIFAQILATITVPATSIFIDPRLTLNLLAQINPPILFTCNPCICKTYQEGKTPSPS